ncbi:prepilin-type N-terminal cleavage/methylation domain-containing protein [Candidatus Azambacteria bacterium]|nr:prepilin-type N-terminal cleavage/methylation domain-containing protein [Candidatus Azambacteria bacterium]
MRQTQLKFNKPSKAERGFSILELLLYMAIFTIISFGLVNMISTLNKGWTRSQVESEVQQSLRYAISAISNDIRKASFVSQPTAGSSGSLLDMNISGQSYKYFLTGAALQKQIGTNPAENITGNNVQVKNLVFYTVATPAQTNAQITATTTQFYIKVGYNSSNPEYSYDQSATSTVNLR